ncbi:hypothetical protein [Oceanisphaera sp. KMM 10153]|uniref:hypothetical protein n=1 Tax=Oceanisphaera submarina TaxID=3390193 RepID=UPI0039759051
MLIIKTIPDITVPVDIQVPGEAEPSRIQATWKLYDYDEAQARIDKINAQKLDDAQLVADDLRGLSELFDEQGQPVAFTPELAQQLLKKTYVRIPLVRSWFFAQNCRTEAAAKN